MLRGPTPTKPTRKQIEWQAEAYKLLDKLPFTHSDPDFVLLYDPCENLRVFAEFTYRGMPAGRWSGEIDDLRYFCEGVCGDS